MKTIVYGMTQEKNGRLIICYIKNKLLLFMTNYGMM